MDLHLEKGGTAYHVQVKSSYAAVNSTRGHRALRNYFGASRLQNSASKDILAVPAGTNLTESTQDILDAMEVNFGRTVEVIDAITP